MGRNVELLSIKACETHNYHRTVKI